MYSSVVCFFHLDIVLFVGGHFIQNAVAETLYETKSLLMKHCML